MNPQDVAQAKKQTGSLMRIMWSKYAYFRYKQDFKHMHKVIAISKDDEILQNEIFPEYNDKTVQIYVPIDVQAIENVHSKKEKIIATINYAYEHKNVMTLVQAFVKIMNDIPHNLVLIGNEYGKCTEYVKAYNLEERIIITGRVSDEVRDDYLSKADVYVNPSWYEGFGITTIEAINHELNIILSDITINHEVAENCAYYFSPVVDANALATAIMDVIENHPVKYTKEDKKRIINRFSCKVIAQQYLDLIKEDIKCHI